MLRSGVAKPVNGHLLRNLFAPVLFGTGYEGRAIPHLLDLACMEASMGYAHVFNKGWWEGGSPLESAFAMHPATQSVIHPGLNAKMSSRNRCRKQLSRLLLAVLPVLVTINGLHL